MGKPIGCEKSGGRQKGTPNKKSLILSDSLDQLGLDVCSKIAELLPQMAVEKQMDTLIHLLPYLFPKRKSLELNVEDISGTERVQSVTEIQEQYDEVLHIVGELKQAGIDIDL